MASPSVPGYTHQALNQARTVTVISVLTKMNGVHKVLRVQIDGQGNFEFSYENDR